MRVSFLQLLGGSFRDLLSSSSTNSQLSLRDYDPSKSPHVSGVNEVTVTSEAEMMECFQHGAARMNPCSEDTARNSNDINGHMGSPAYSGRSDDSFTCMPGSGSPESHLIFSFHIHLQGPITLMPSQHNSAKAKPKPSGQRRKAPGPPKAVEEWIFRSVLRCVDICVPLSRSDTSTPERSSLATVHTVHHANGARPERASLPASCASELHSPAVQASQPDHANHETHRATMDSSSIDQVAGSPPEGLSPRSIVPSPPPQRGPSVRDSVATHLPQSRSCLHGEGDEQVAGHDGDQTGAVGDALTGFTGHEDASADAEALGSDNNRKRTREAFVFKALAGLQGAGDAAREPSHRQRPHHDVSPLVGLQTSARRLRKSQSTRAPVIMSLATGAAARAPSLKLPAADVANDERAVVNQVSGAQALEAVVHARQEQKAMLPFRCAPSLQGLQLHHPAVDFSLVHGCHKRGLRTWCGQVHGQAAVLVNTGVICRSPRPLRYVVHEQLSAGSYAVCSFVL